MVNHEEHDKYVVEMKPLRAATTCKDQAKGLGLTLAHRQGVCSPIAANRQSRNSKLIFLRDQSRVNSMNVLGQSGALPAEDHGEHAQMPIRRSSPGMGEFVVTIGIGTPKVDLPLIFDTGSEVTWTKCGQQGPLFDPHESKTFSWPRCSASKCNYSINYADGSYSNGEYVQDLLTLTPEYQFEDFVFGCSQSYSDNFGATAGVLGLGQGDNTLISRIEQNFSTIFCYCIPGSESSSGYLLFGFNALTNCQTDNITPLIIDQYNPSYYFVNLVGIALGNQTFSLSSESPPPRTIIDSGTTFTRLPPSIYEAVRAEFVKYMSTTYSVAKPLSTLDTCYDLRGQENVKLPKMILQFENTDITLDSSAVVWRENDDAQVCLAFKPNPPNSERQDLVIIGYVQQQNLNILFNIQEKKLHFGTGRCGN
ncbi:hypothetical protein EUGRSUZ_G02376 [Eucalyptus grandis]|uniref:Peptidase A1 domain-containing protein n=2 Tax=Eucalyptus grandis TaxID=71139 RepID=A0A059BFH2_EUCGR|nr:hypothetical protein EUGRSUZ_G02376 [Eucalyptus grandis]